MDNISKWIFNYEAIFHYFHSMNIINKDFPKMIKTIKSNSIIDRRFSVEENTGGARILAWGGGGGGGRAPNIYKTNKG